MSLDELAGRSLGSRTVNYDERDAILYALAVGASWSDLPLVYERDLTVVLPSYAAALAMWATSRAAEVGGYDESTVLHMSQSVRIRCPLPPNAEFETTAHVRNVFDKVKAALVDVVVESEYFECRFLMYVPGVGGFGGERGASSRPPHLDEPDLVRQWQIPENAAVLYRLTGDPHPVHVDPVIAERAGYRRPILHGLCTFGIVVREAAEALGLGPEEVSSMTGSFLRPVIPGQTLEIRIGPSYGGSTFDARVDDEPVLAGTLTTGEIS